MAREALVSTGEVARLCAVSVQAVRNWTRLGRLPVAVQSKSGIRLYKRRDVERVARARQKRAANGA